MAQQQALAAARGMASACTQSRHHNARRRKWRWAAYQVADVHGHDALSKLAAVDPPHGVDASRRCQPAACDQVIYQPVLCGGGALLAATVRSGRAHSGAVMVAAVVVMARRGRRVGVRVVVGFCGVAGDGRAAAERAQARRTRVRQKVLGLVHTLGGQDCSAHGFCERTLRWRQTQF